MTLQEKASYLKGLAEGLGLDKDKKESKLIMAMVDLLDDMAMSVTDLEDGLDDVCDQLDAVDDDLSALEDDLYEDEDDECCGCECDDDDEFYEVKCPTCGETICLSQSILDDGKMDCPNCGEVLEFDLDDVCCCGEDCNCEPECNCSAE